MILAISGAGFIGTNFVFDRLYVNGHCSIIRRLLEAERLGEAYNVGGWNEKPNIEIVSPPLRPARRISP